MTKATVTLKPSEQLVQEATHPVQVTDTRGRVISLQKPPVLAQFRLIKILGDAATNQTYVQMLMPLIYVTMIDDDPVAFPQTEREIEALIQRLDDDGVTAVMQGLQQNFGQVDPEVAKRDIKK